jgi:hypothetical protein
MNDVATFLHAKSVNPPVANQSPTLNAGKTFRIKTGVFKGEVYKVERIVPADSFDVVCSGEKFDRMCFNSGQLKLYGYTILDR